MTDIEDGKLVGIIGGMSWESTVSYYQAINRGYNAIKGGHHSAPLLIHSVDFGPIEALQRSGDWDGTAEILSEAAAGLERAGVGLLLLATNTMHLVFDRLVEASSVPWVHIADATGNALTADRRESVALLGTRFTMEKEFYRSRLSQRFGVEVVVPDAQERREIDRIIFEELVHGTIRDESRGLYRTVIERLAGEGADAVILGCTEIGLLVDPEEISIPTYDTAQLHAAAAVEWLIRMED